MAAKSAFSWGRSLGGFAVGAVLFGAMGFLLNVRIQAPIFANLQEVGVLAVIGGTVSGLVSPLIWSPGMLGRLPLIRRLRRPERRGAECAHIGKGRES